MTEEEKIRLLYHCVLEIAKSCQTRGCPQLNPEQPCWCMQDAQTIWDAMQARGLDICYRQIS